MSVFISHSRQNAGAAARLSAQLESRGVKPWLDADEIEVGADWKDKVAEAIRNADAFVFLIGSPDCQDGGQRYEWERVIEDEHYLNLSKPLIPVLLGTTEVPSFLRTRRAIRVEPSSPDFGMLADQVLEAMKHPEHTIDQEALERGRAARRRAQESLREYARELEAKQLRQAGL